MLISVDIVGHLAAGVSTSDRFICFSFADVILIQFDNDLEANVSKSDTGIQSWQITVQTLFSSHWALTIVRYTMAVHVRLSLGLRQNGIS